MKSLPTHPWEGGGEKKAKPPVSLGEDCLDVSLGEGQAHLLGEQVLQLLAHAPRWM